MIRGLLALILLLASCATPAKVQSNLDIGDNFVTLRIKNEETRATTPLLITLAVQFRNNGKWGESDTILHPAGFVLKGREEQILRAMLRPSGDAVKATLTIKEQESGRTLSRKEIEKNLRT